MGSEQRDQEETKLKEIIISAWWTLKSKHASISWIKKIRAIGEQDL